MENSILIAQQRRQLILVAERPCTVPRISVPFKADCKDKSDVVIGRNALIVSPADIGGSIEKAMAFLTKHGLKADRVNVAENMPKLDSLDRVSPEQAAAVREGMKRSAFWRITPSGTAMRSPYSPLRASITIKARNPADKNVVP